MRGDKQIDVIYEDLVEIFDEEYNRRNLITPQNTAERMTAKGYRKATDVAEEIFAEIEETLAPTISALFMISETLVDVSKSHISDEDAIKKIRDYLSGTISSKYRLKKTLAEIKKKYTEEGI